LLGYIPGAEAVEAVGKEIRSLKSRAEEEGGGEQLLYLLDRKLTPTLTLELMLIPPSYPASTKTLDLDLTSLLYTTTTQRSWAI